MARPHGPGQPGGQPPWGTAEPPWEIGRPQPAFAAPAAGWLATVTWT
jgi:hypothetical protein